jgi:hypothetical protein
VTPASAIFPSTTISLNQIPDKLIIFVRKQGQVWDDSDAYLPIDKITMNFNNCSGLLSSFSPYDLWRMSVENGSNQTWDEFRGYSYMANPAETK